MAVEEKKNTRKFNVIEVIKTRKDNIRKAIFTKNKQTSKQKQSNKIRETYVFSN